MIYKKITITYLLSLFVGFVCVGQTINSKTADAYFNKLAYVKSASLYEKIVKKNSSQFILQRLGDSYYFNTKMKQASKWYAKLFSEYKNIEAEYYFKYAQSLRGIGSLEASNVWMNKFHKKKSKDFRGNDFTSKSKNISEIKEISSDYSIRNEENLNTDKSDFGATFYKDKVLFSSSRKEGKLIKRIYSWNNQPFLDLYLTDSVASDSGKSFSKRINSIYHESSVAFSPDYKTIYFTRNNYTKGKLGRDKKGINNLTLYKADYKKGKWTNIVALPFNSNEYSVGHPSVSKDGTKLYFASDMPGTIGKTDIFYVVIKGNNKYGPIENLGIEVNTEGREMFPYITEDKLYFSSDGHFGLGGLDLFVSKKEKGFFTEPSNLKSPMNSELDDFSLVINPATKKGYFSSNRKGGKGSDDIYSFVETTKKKAAVKLCNQVVSGVVKDKKFKKPLAGARVVLKNDLGVVVKDTIVGMKGEFKFLLACNKKYTAHATKEYYKPDQDSFVTTDSAKIELDLDFAMEIVDDFIYNERNQLVIKIKPIFFDYNKSDIRNDASIELNRVIAAMQKYAKIEIRSSSHTDARGKSTYNEKLSERRAKSTVAYIVSKGINSSRIKGKGFGETQLTNGCVDNDRHTNRVKCSQEEHQENRRTEFVIIKM